MMEIRLARHSRHVAVVTVDNQPRLNALTRQPPIVDAALGRMFGWAGSRAAESECVGYPRAGS